MVSISHVGQLVHYDNPIRHYYKTLRERIENDVVCRWLPALLTVPLEIEEQHTPLLPLLLQHNASHAHHTFSALYGGHGSGRSLALLQYAYRAAQNNLSPAVVMVPLATIDNTTDTPHMTFARWLHNTGLHPTPYALPTSNKLAAAEHAKDTDTHDDTPQIQEAWRNEPLVLLVDEWEALPPPRRTLWHNYLLTLSQEWHALHMIIALPLHHRGKHAAMWHSFVPMTMASPDWHQIQRWLAHVVPQHMREPVLAELASHNINNDGVPIIMNLRDVVLVALLAKQHHTQKNKDKHQNTAILPTSRLDVYHRCYKMLHNTMQHTPMSVQRVHVLGGDEQHVVMQHAGAHSSLYPSIATKHGVKNTLIAQKATTDRGYWSPLFISYEQAHMMMTLHNNKLNSLDVILLLDDLYRVDTAPILTLLLPDPSLLYALLWKHELGSTVPDDVVVLLLRCLALRPTDTPTWNIRVLAHVTTHHPDDMHVLLHPFISSLHVWLDCAIAASNAKDTDVETLLANMLSVVPIAPALLLRMVDQQQFSDTTRWLATDAIVQYVKQHTTQPNDDVTFDNVVQTTDILDTLSQAARCYILAHGTTHHRSILARADSAGWMVALRDEQVAAYRRSQVATALLNDANIPTVLRHTALILLSGDDDSTTRAMLQRMCFDTNNDVRSAALAALRYRSPQQVFWILQDVATMNGLSWHVQRDVLEQLAYYSHTDATVLLVRCILSRVMPLHGKLRALALLAPRGTAGILLLRRLMKTDTVHRVVQAMAAHTLGTLQAVVALPELRHAALLSPDPLLQQHAITALGTIATATTCPPDKRNEIIAIHTVALEQSYGNAEMMSAIITSLAYLAHHVPTTVQPIVTILHTMLTSDLHALVRHWWFEHVPNLPQQNPTAWQTLTLAPELRMLLLSALTRGATSAEHPGSVDEFVAGIVMHIEQTVVDVLAHIGTAADDTMRQHIRDMLIATLKRTTYPSHMRHMVRCVVSISESYGIDELDLILTDTTTDPTLRWVAIEQCGMHPAAVPLLMRHVQSHTHDPFTRGTLALMLGHHQEQNIIYLLSKLAMDDNQHVSMQALIALGMHNTIETIPVLLTVLDDPQQPTIIRGQAARSLPTQLPNNTRHWLREQLRHSTQHYQHPTIVEGILASLGATRDYEASGLMIHYAQHAQPTIALAALAALAELGNDNIAPILVRIAQDTTTDDSVRLSAVMTLLRLCGDDYVPFLRGFLDCDILPLQLQALDELLTRWHDYAQPLIVVANTTAPLALRLRALEAMTQQQYVHPILYDLLVNANESHELRAHIATLLGDVGGVESVPHLIRCITDANVPPYLRRRACDALTQQAQSQRVCAEHAQQAISRLAETPTLPAEIYAWIATGLIHVPSHQTHDAVLSLSLYRS